VPLCALWLRRLCLWRYVNLFIIILLLLFFIPQVVKIPGVKNYN